MHVYMVLTQFSIVIPKTSSQWEQTQKKIMQRNGSQNYKFTD